MRGMRRNSFRAIGLPVALLLLTLPAIAGAMTGRLVASLEGSAAGGIPPSLVISGEQRAESILLGAIALAAGQVTIDDLPPGSYRIALDQGGAPGDRAHGLEIGIFPGRTTAVRIDLAAGRVVVEPFAPDPFGFVEVWEGGALEPLPGSGDDAARFLTTTPIRSRQITLDRLDLTGSGFRHRTRLQGESIARAVAVPAGPVPASFEEPTLQAVSRRETSYGDVQIQTGSRGRTSWEGTFARAFPEAPGDLRVFGSYRGIQELDAAPSALEDDRLPHNGREGIELYTRVDGRIGGSTRLTGLLYGEGTIRKYFLEAYRFNTRHAPKEERAGLQGALRLTHDRSPRLRLLGEVALQRTFLESGDGVHFDNLLGYQQLGDPGAGEDGLYWRDGHVYDYFRRKVQVEWTARLETWRDPGSAEAIGAGLLVRRGTYRSYEHLRPTFFYDTGFNDAQSIGYTPNGEEHSDDAGREPGRPWTIGAFVTARRAVAGGEAEIGARLTHFRPGQQGLASLTDPFGENEAIDDADLSDENTTTTVDPRLAYTRPLGPRARVWLAGAGETWIPPSEALYYSEIFLASRAISVSEANPLDLVFGNPNLEPERAWVGSAAIGIEPLSRLWL
ncbi:MAG: hypothetical protein GF346_12030, partial [Candidatus Eisenbacteria bacterium]|nr:hypothetical protein [Candidatus Latescibacterota bacterium]MBD3303165.1 hypothetical protein [Candidatus Eisenbacteria bacterium]